MKIIIPMTGYGSRFSAAGYKELKPFIEVQRRPIIEWIVRKMYPGEKNFLFVCRSEHLRTIAHMKKKLLSIAPYAQIFEITDWDKKGPVDDVLRAIEMIGDDEQCVINYCDFYMQWNYPQFADEVTKRDCEGCIPCYSGFHPHLLVPGNVYASCKVDDQNNLVEIREKYSFEADKTKALHSPGVYWFKTGEILKNYCQKLVDSGNPLNGEYYASLVYNNMLQDGLKVWCPVNATKFCQWGTPEDLEEYLFWTNLVSRRDNV